MALLPYFAIDLNTKTWFEKYYNGIGYNAEIAAVQLMHPRQKQAESERMNRTEATPISNPQSSSI